MKNRSALVLSVLMLLSLSACGGGSASSEPVDGQVSESSSQTLSVDNSSDIASTESSFEISAIEDFPETTTTGDDSSETAVVNSTPIHVGEVGIIDGLRVSFIDCFPMEQVKEGTYLSYKPEEGFIYMISVLDIENTSSSIFEIWPASDFDYYADNTLMDGCLLGYTPPTINGYKGIESETEVNPGRKVTGYVVAEVPANTVNFEFEYQGMLFANY